MPYAPSEESLSPSPSPTPEPERLENSTEPTVKLEQPIPNAVPSNSAWLEHPDHPKLYNTELLDPKTAHLTRFIADQPIIRSLTLRSGKALRYLHKTNHGLGNYRAALAYQRGKVQLTPCSCCAGSPRAPMGPFQQCVVLSSFGLGACTNCSYDGNGTRCTLRENKLNGTPLNPNTHKRKHALEREDNGDNVANEIVDVEEETSESARTTPGSGVIQTRSPSASATNPGYIRRQAAKDAENRLSTYTYRATDIGGSSFGSSSAVEPAIESPGIESPLTANGSAAAEAYSENKVADTMSIEGWPDLGRLMNGSSRANMQRPRGSFMARRGGKHSYSHPQMDAVSNEDAKSALGTPEEIGDTDESEQAERSRRVYTSPSPEDDAIIYVDQSVAPTPNETRLQDILIPDTGRTLTMTHLLTLPARRPIEWRPEATKSLNLKAQVEAAMGYCVGDVVAPCSRCARGSGAFANCVTVYGNFQSACVSCTYTSTAPICTFHIPNSTKHGIVLEIDASRPPPKKRQRKQKSEIFAPNFSAAGHMKQQSQQSPVETSYRPAIVPQNPRAHSSTAISPPSTSRSPNSKVEITNRSSRYVKAIFDAQHMSQEEQQLELADLKFQVFVVNNIIANTTPAQPSPRYKQAEVEFVSMSREERALELAGFNFRLSVLMDAMGPKKK